MSIPSPGNDMFVRSSLIFSFGILQININIFIINLFMMKFAYFCEGWGISVKAYNSVLKTSDKNL